MPAEELPDILLSLLCVALDVTTPRQVQDEIIVSVDTIISSIEDSDAGRSLVCYPCSSYRFEAHRDPQEGEIASKILAFMDELQPVNKAYLLSFFNRGCKQNGRISRWIARACLLQSQSSSIVRVSAAPLVYVLN